MRKNNAGYAIVDAGGVIVSLHTGRVAAGSGWGFDRELVELRYPHRVGDVIEYDRHGRELGRANGGTRDGQ